MKKRLCCVLFAAMLLLALALPCMAAEEEKECYYENVTYSAVVHENGTASVTLELEVAFPAGHDNLDFYLPSFEFYNGSEITDLTVKSADGTPYHAETDYLPAVTLGDSSTTGTHHFTLDYTLSFYDDLTEEMEWFELDFGTNRLHGDIRSFTGTVVLPAGAAIQKWELEDAIDGQLNPDYAAAAQAENVITVTAKDLRGYYGLALYVQCDNGLFTQRATHFDDFVMKDRVCSITVDSEMVYTVQEHIVVEANNKRDSVYLYAIDFREYDTKCRLAYESGTDNITVNSYGDDLYFYLDTQNSTGVYEADYTYTITPVKINTPFDLVFGATDFDRTDAMKIIFTAPGLQNAQGGIRYSNLSRVPSAGRVTGVQDGNTYTMTLNTPLYGDETIEFTAAYDSSLYVRPVNGMVWKVLLAAVLCLVACVVCRLLFGMPAAVTAQPEHTPPEGMNSAEAGYLKDGTLTNTELASLVLQWVATGAVTGEESGGEYIFYRVHDPIGCAPYELALFQAMFAYGKDGYVTTVQLRGCFHRDISAARLALLSQYRGGRALETGGAAKWVGMVLAALPMLVFGILAAGVSGFGAFWALPAGLGCMLLQLLLSCLCLPAFAPHRGALPRGKRPHGVLRTTCLVLLLVGAAVFCALLKSWFPVTSLGLMIPVVVLCLLGAALSAGSLRRGKAAQQLLCRVRGFCETLLTTDGKAMKNEIEKNQNYYYEMLPYAMVFGMADAWRRNAWGAQVPLPKGFTGATGYGDYTEKAAQLLRVLRTCTVPSGQ